MTSTIINVGAAATAVRMPNLPPMGKRGGTSTGTCACGCGGATKRTWTSGHDGRATGWAIRVERGLLGLADVPANERAGAVIMLERRGTLAAVEERDAVATEEVA